MNPQTTWITESDDWVEYFSHALSVHHGTTTEPLGLTGFEIVFCNACDAVGWEYERPASATHRFDFWFGSRRPYGVTSDGDRPTA